MSMDNMTNENEMKENEEVISENAQETENLSAAETEAVAPENNQVNALLMLQNEVTAQKDKFIRLYSEFENFRRRTAKEKLEMIHSANEQLLKNLLPVVDDFDRAEKALKEKNDKDLEGVFLIQNKFKKTLEQYGVKLMDVKQGSDFNADLHEAITQIPAPEEKLKGKVVDVVESGYLLNDKVIRFAKVVVGS
jgi:molecular chaperone GrpE